MKKTVDKDYKLRFREIFGMDFVFKCLKIFILDPIYFRDIMSKVKPEYFFVDGYATEEIVGVMLRLTENGLFNREDLTLCLKNEYEGNEGVLLKISATLSKIDEVEVVDNYDTIKANLENRLIAAKLIEITFDIQYKLTWERYKDNYKKLLEDLFIIASKEVNMSIEDRGSMAEDDINEALAEESLEYIPTGEKKIDELTGGGAVRGSVAGFIAPTGYGKSTFSAMIGLEMARLGYKVIHIFFEDKKPLMWRKYYSRLTGKPISEIEGEDVEDLIRKNPDFNKIKENIVLVKWETGEKTVADIEQLLMQKVYSNFNADVVMVDYFDCLKMSSNPIKDRLLAEEQAMRKLENLAYKRNILIWAMMQANRLATSNSNNDGIAQNIEGSKKKKNIASTVLALGKDVHNPGYYAFEVDKCRSNGKECIVRHVMFKPGEAKFDWTGSEIEYRNIADNSAEDEWLCNITVEEQRFIDNDFRLVQE